MSSDSRFFFWHFLGRLCALIIGRFDFQLWTRIWAMNHDVAASLQGAANSGR